MLKFNEFYRKSICQHVEDNLTVQNEWVSSTITAGGQNKADKLAAWEALEASMLPQPVMDDDPLSLSR
jgi:hypothetical protein